MISEESVAKLLGQGWERNKVSKNGFLVEGSKERIKGSTAPDFINTKTMETVEVKNYNISTNQGIENLVSVTAGQAKHRATQLPSGYTQKVYVDITGQSLSKTQIRNIKQKIADRSGGVLKFENIEIDNFTAMANNG